MNLLTPTKAAKKAQRKFGFVVIGFPPGGAVDALMNGYVTGLFCGGWLDGDLRLRVIGRSSYDEWEAQRQLFFGKNSKERFVERVNGAVFQKCKLERVQEGK